MWWPTAAIRAACSATRRAPPAAFSRCPRWSSDPMALSQLTDLTLADARDGLKAKKFSARELAAAHNKAVEAIKPLNAFITATPERALDMAAASDARLAKGAALPLDGIPLAIKDLFCTRGVLTTAGSHILDGFT